MWQNNITNITNITDQVLELIRGVITLKKTSPPTSPNPFEIPTTHNHLPLK
jgi:hypothetical protein